MKFPVDVPKRTVIHVFKSLGFQTVREGNHIIMERKNPDGTVAPLVFPNHRTIKGSTLRRILSQSAISREDFLEAYSKS